MLKFFPITKVLTINELIESYGKAKIKQVR